MKVISRVLILPCATAILIAVVAWFAHAGGSGSWFLAFCAIWVVLMWVASLHLLIHLWLPEWYFHSRDFEKSGRIYELFGVLLLRKLVQRGPIHILAPAIQYSGVRESLRSLELEMRKAESIHQLAFLASLLLLTYALYNGWLDSAGWLLFFNTILNVYPVALQRYNRVRLERLLEKKAPHQPLQQKGLALPVYEPSSQAGRPDCWYRSF